MANIYIEFTYSDGSKDVSNCERMYVDYYNVDRNKKIVSTYYSTICDRGWHFGMADDTANLRFETAPKVILDGSLYGSTSVAGIELTGGTDVNYVFTENCKVFNITDKNEYLEIDCNSLTFEGKTPPTMNLISGYKLTSLNAIYVPKDAVETYKGTTPFFKDNASLIQAILDVEEMVIDHIKIGDVTYKIKGESTEVDAYTKAETDSLLANKADTSALNNLATKAELSSKQDKMLLEKFVTNVYDGYNNYGVTFDIKDYSYGADFPYPSSYNLNLATIDGNRIWSSNESGFGFNFGTINGKKMYVSAKGSEFAPDFEFPTLDEFNSAIASKQDKLQGDYVKDVEIGGGYITFNSMKFDGNNNGVKTANFKTINNQAILGAGNIDINVDTSNLAPKSDLGGLKLVKITQSAYDSLTNKDENTLYIING